MPKSLGKYIELFPLSRHAWVCWLRGDDAQTLLWQVCEWVDDPTIPREGLTDRINAWQQNAQKAVGSQSWTVRIDPRLRVCLDQYLFHFDMRMRAWT